MSALPPIADKQQTFQEVRLGPQAEVLQLAIGLQQMPLPFSWHAQHIPPWVVHFPDRWAQYGGPLGWEVKPCDGAH
jgi:hypothetical protein